MRPLLRSLLLLVAAASTLFLFLPASAGRSPRQGTALTADQEALLTEAQKDFAAARWADAFAKCKTLHAEAPANPVFAKFEAEAAVNTGDTGTAIDLLQPVLESASEDPQALGILVHAYAQAHRSTERDSTLAHLQRLYDKGTIALKSLVVETISTPTGGNAAVLYFLEPWSRYNICLMARLYNAAGKQTSRLTLESNDTDQPLFAKQHPTEAAAGMRLFSIDGYTETPAADGSPATQNHATYGFFPGRPSYDTFRDKVLAIAGGKSSPISSRSGIPAPSSTP